MKEFGTALPVRLTSVLSANTGSAASEEEIELLKELGSYLKFEIRMSISLVFYQMKNLDRLEESGYQYLVGARIKNMPNKATEQILSGIDYQTLSLGDDQCSYKIIELNVNQQLLVNYSEIRARKDAHERDKAIKKIK